jgi:hypothetical protein
MLAPVASKTPETVKRKDVPNRTKLPKQLHDWPSAIMTKPPNPSPKQPHATSGVGLQMRP